ncbi:hypothetical protein [Ruminiclostridium papyrosolvens]|uniref:Uncharacterized protein n=1 Tax=Ruminiclostridium papyrosolvens C7 TaxID=1330534 RepID=U4QWR8_9FIRM|nr:hypothetical protein [Ruminiclostridium papyrosolvens]EPR07761.1 hypothetical protein L323_19870 [Ruminiclostridium papyrosolvens C7]
MTLIFVMLKVLVFALCAGAIVSVVILIPTFLYTIPYTLWVGRENTMGRHKDKSKESIFRAARNATKLYKSWITRQKPTF